MSGRGLSGWRRFLASGIAAGWRVSGGHRRVDRPHRDVRAVVVGEVVDEPFQRGVAGLVRRY